VIALKNWTSNATAVAWIKFGGGAGDAMDIPHGRCQWKSTAPGYNTAQSLFTCVAHILMLTVL